MARLIDLTGGVLTYAEAARELGVSRQAVQQMALAGTLPRVTMHKRDYVSASAVLDRKRRLIAERTIGQQSTKGGV